MRLRSALLMLVLLTPQLAVAQSPYCRPGADCQPMARVVRVTPRPPEARQWFDADFGGVVVKLYGWKDSAGMIRWDRAQNPAVTPELLARLNAPRPTTQPQAAPVLTAMPGVTMDSSGSLNAGVDLPKIMSRDGQLDTNDRPFAEAFFKAGPTAAGEASADDDFILRIGPEHRDHKQYLLPGAIVMAAVILGIVVLAKRKAEAP